MNSVMDTLQNDNINEMNSIAEMEAFRYGVRFSIRLIMETSGSLECPSAIQETKIAAASDSGAAIVLKAVLLLRQTKRKRS